MRGITPLIGAVVWLAFLVCAAPDARAEESFLDKKARRSVSTVALSLARKKHEASFRELLEILRSLGLSAEEMAALEKKGAQQLERARRVRDAQAERKKLQALVGQLAARLPDLEPEPRRYLAGVILRLDAEEVAAREALGYVRHAGGWTPAALVPLLERRTQIEEIVKKHRRAQYEIELGVSDEPTFVRAYGGKGARARHKTVEVHGARTGAHGARRILLQALRAWGLAAELAGIPGDLLPKDPVRAAFHGTYAEYLRSIRQAVAAGRLPAEAAAQAADHRTYRTSDGYFVSTSGVEAHHQTFVLFEIWFTHARRRWDDKQPLPCLEAGFLNWVMLQVMGCPLPRIRWAETAYEKHLGATLSDADDVRRKHLLKLSEAGLAGTRAYMRFLMARRLDPPWRNAFHDVLGKVRGHDLLKCTVMNEYLLEAALLPKAFAQTLEVDEKSVEATSAGLEKAIGRSLAALEDDVRTWMMHRAPPGLLQRLAVPPAVAAPLSDTPVPYLTALRKRAYPGSSPLALEPELTAGAVAHARYLARHPKQAQAWPDAHEEYVDHEGYSPAGARAAAAAVIAPGSRDWKHALDAWMGTFFHRLPLLDPGLVGVGAGLEGGMAVLDSASLVDEVRTREYVAWPPKGATGVPLHFEPELPNPVPGVSQATLGYPITLQVYCDAGQPEMTMRLYDGDVPVECHFSAPHAPRNPELVPEGAYCLIPMAPLKPTTLYTVRVENLIHEGADGKPGRRTMIWSFRTGP